MRAFFIGTMCLATLWAAGMAQAQTPTPTPIDCEAVRCQVQGTISACLTGAKNHGQCVSCVAHAVHDPSIPHQCRGKIVRCAARSTCGKPGFETCTTTEAGMCDTSTGQCSEGTLAAGVTACMQDSDCVATDCGIMRAFPPNTTPTPGQDSCTLRGGTPGTGSCCASCPTAP